MCLAGEGIHKGPRLRSNRFFCRAGQTATRLRGGYFYGTGQEISTCHSAQIKMKKIAEADEASPVDGVAGSFSDLFEAVNWTINCDCDKYDLDGTIELFALTGCPSAQLQASKRRNKCG